MVALVSATSDRVSFSSALPFWPDAVRLHECSLRDERYGRKVMVLPREKYLWGSPLTPLTSAETRKLYINRPI